MTNLALLLDAMGKVDEAERLFRTSVEAKRRRLGMSDPYTRIAISGYARLLERQERHDEALPLRRELLEHELALAESPGAPVRSLNRVAWALLTHDHAELRDATRALGLARRAAELSDHDDPAILDTLALALFETGDVDAAIETERRALELLPADAPDRDGYVAALERFESALAGPGER